MDNWLHFLILGLATWRLTSLFNREHGPYGMFDWIRHKVGVEWDTNNNPYGKTELAKGLLCPYCCSVWFGAIVIGIYALLPISIWLFGALALSTIACIIHGVVWTD